MLKLCLRKVTISFIYSYDDAGSVVTVLLNDEPVPKDVQLVFAYYKPEGKVIYDLR